MAIVNLSYVICDVCGTPGSEPVDGSKSARHWASQKGFTSVRNAGYDRRRVRDYCPEHKPAEREDDRG